MWIYSLGITLCRTISSSALLSQQQQQVSFNQIHINNNRTTNEKIVNRQNEQQQPQQPYHQQQPNQKEIISGIGCVDDVGGGDDCSQRNRIHYHKNNMNDKNLEFHNHCTKQNTASVNLHHNNDNQNSNNKRRNIIYTSLEQVIATMCEPNLSRRASLMFLLDVSIKIVIMMIKIS
jgi:hypothetical protein